MERLKLLDGKIKGLCGETFCRDAGLALVVILTAMAAFSLGRLSVLEGKHPPVKIYDASGKEIIPVTPK